MIIIRSSSRNYLFVLACGGATVVACHGPTECDEMKALYLRRPGEFDVIDREGPISGNGDTVIRVRWSGICATDVATIEGISPVAVYPMTPGHEFIGTVVTTPAAGSFRPGDWVTIYPTQGCGSCSACAAGRPNLCRGFKVYGVHRDGGSFAEMIAVASSQLLPVPEELQNQHGALIEPVAVAVHANRRANVAAGGHQKVGVIGLGVIGSLIAQVARARGVTDIVLADRLASRRQLCADLGFDRFVHAADTEQLRDGLTRSGPYDLVFDNACTPDTVRASIDSLVPGGTLILLGFPHGGNDIPLSYVTAYQRELSILLSRNYAREDFIEAIELLRSGAIDAQRMITGTWPLERFHDAYRSLRGEPGRHLKVLITP